MKERLTLSIDRKVVEDARGRGINISQLAEKCLFVKSAETPEIPVVFREVVKVNLVVEGNIINSARKSGLNMSLEVEKCLRKQLYG